MSVVYDQLTAVQQATVQAIVNVANKLGVNPRTALASAYVESGFIPTQVGDHGTSFGIFQLHKGGELGTATPQQAFDPTFNANVALSVFKANQNSFTDPGVLAARSQRPADQIGYAAKVDALYNDPTFLANIGSSSNTGSGGSVASTTATPVNWTDTLTGGLDVGQALTRVTLIVFGLCVVAVALHALASNGATPIAVSVDGGKRAANNVRRVAA